MLLALGCDGFKNVKDVGVEADWFGEWKVQGRSNVMTEKKWENLRKEVCTTTRMQIVGQPGSRSTDLCQFLQECRSSEYLKSAHQRAIKRLGALSACTQLRTCMQKRPHYLSFSHHQCLPSPLPQFWHNRDVAHQKM